MDSINEQQPEQNRADLDNVEAAKKIKELIEKAKSCFFCTDAGSLGSVGTRPMSVQKIENDGTIWFLSANDSHKNQEIARSSSVKLYFQGSAHSDFLYLSGDASIIDDKAKIKELWNPVLKTWFTEGERDPRISVIQFVPTEGYYWDTKHSQVVAGAKILVGALLGKTLDDSIEGTLRL